MAQHLLRFRFCPSCGAESIRCEEEKRYECDACDFLFFKNSAAAVCCVIHEGGDVLVAVRGRDPGKSLWDFPGGFVDLGESAETALRRELREEIGYEPEQLEYLASAPNIYPYAGVVYHTLDICFEGFLAARPQVVAADDVADLFWVPLVNIDPERFAFASTREFALRISLRNVNRQ